MRSVLGPRPARLPSPYMFLIVLIMAFVMVAVWALLRSARAAAPPGTDLMSPVHLWFEKQHSVSGAWCCDISDGHVVEEDDWRSNNGLYEVRIDNTWRAIPASALRDPVGGPNPTNHAVVWYTATEYGLQIYCFAPGTEY